MLALRTTKAAASRIPRVVGRRNYSAHGDAHHHAHRAPAEESFGKGFYIGIAAVVGTLAAVKVEQNISGSEQSAITRLIDSYGDHEKLYAARNLRHTAMVEQAGRDRNLFQNSKPSSLMPVRDYDTFNTGSPYNNEAGWSGGNLTELKKHLEGKYQK